MEDFNEFEFEDMPNAICPNCSTPVPDYDNGSDPAVWWRTENIPECDLKHKCQDCGQEFRISVSWSPKFTVVPKEFDDSEYDYSLLDKA